jgi:Flp pilus assembly protein TadD
VEYAASNHHCEASLKLYKNWKNAVAYILETVVTRANTSEAQDLFEQGLDLLAAGFAAEAVCAFRTAVAIDPAYYEAHHGLVRALRDAGELEKSVAAALALTALTPADPLAHTALSISLQQAGHVPEAEVAATRARIQEWRVQLQSPPTEDFQR